MKRPVWFIRHGESTANATGVLAGHTDADLTERGVAQAAALAPRLADLPVARIVASDLTRAWRTAALAWPQGVPPVEQHVGLRERNAGDWEMRPTRELGPEVKEVLLSWERPPPGGESQAMLAHRVLTWLAEHDDGRNTLLFVHGGLIRCVVGLLDGTPTDRIGTWKVRNTEIAARDVAPERWQALLDEHFAKPKAR